MVFNITSSKVGKVKSIYSEQWYFDGASQGVYGRNADQRLGAILFKGLHDIDWSSQAISKISLTMKFPNTGYSRKKTIGLCKGTKSEISGLGIEMLGEKIGEFRTSSRAYNSIVINIFDEQTDKPTFDGLISWLKDGTSPILVTYIDEHNTDSSYSDNYATIQSMTMEIEYEAAGSNCTLSSDSVLAGESIACRIMPIASDGVVTHAVQWMLGNAKSDLLYLDESLTASFIVPLDWIAQIPDDNIGIANCRLTTYINGEENASRLIPFSVIVPESIVPSFEYAITPYDTQNGFYQKLSGANIAFINVSTQYGASVKSYNIVGSENVLSNSDSCVTPKFSDAGMHSYMLTVTDSRNRSTSVIADINVIEVIEPVIHSFRVKRYGSYVDDYGQTVYRDDMGGGFVWVSIDAEIDLADENNTPAAYITYESSDGSVVGRVDVPWDVSSERMVIENNRSIIDFQMPLNDSFLFTLYVRDLLVTISASTQIEKSFAPMHIPVSGYGVAFGGYSYASSEKPEVRSYWPVYGSDGFRLDGYIEEKITDFSPEFESYSDLRHPHVMRTGRMVTLTGACKPTTSIPGSSTWHTMFTLPEQFRPVHPINVLCQGSAYYQWVLQINTAGVVEFSRYRAGNSYVAADTSAMLTFHTSWIAMDIPVETPDDDSGDDVGELTYITYPAVAMTSNSSQNCVASASSRQSSTYAAYRAFDNERGNAWASDSGDSAPWIQLQMPQALKRISVKVYSYDTSNKYKGDPISGTLMGSNDGSTWTQIGAYSGWSEGTGGLLGEVVCDNSEAYSYVRLNIASYTSGKSYVSIGYITITGGVPVK